MLSMVSSTSLAIRTSCWACVALHKCLSCHTIKILTSGTSSSWKTGKDWTVRSQTFDLETLGFEVSLYRNGDTVNEENVDIDDKTCSNISSESE